MNTAHYALSNNKSVRHLGALNIPIMSEKTSQVKFAQTILFYVFKRSMFVTIKKLIDDKYASRFSTFPSCKRFYDISFFLKYLETS